MPDLATLNATLAAIVAGGGTGAPRRICETCVAVLTVDRAAISVMSTPDHREPMWSSDAVATELDDLQFGLGEGPCVEAFVERRPVLVADLYDGMQRRWPVFAAAARKLGVRAVFVLPVQVGTVTIGVLELSRDTPGMLSDRELTGALLAADAALWALIGPHGGGRVGDVEGGDGDGHGVDGHGVDGRAVDGHGVDGRAVDGAVVGGAALLDKWVGGTLHRTEVYQAMGMVSEQLKIAPDVALSVLRAYAFRQGRSIGGVARDVVARRIRMDEET